MLKVVPLGLGLGSANVNYLDAVSLVTGITLGSAIWGLLLCSSVAYVLHNRVSQPFMRMINWISGGIILAFGLFALKVVI